MISFRYHVVTIVAVFLAIGVGVLVGTTVLDQGLVSNLKDQTQKLEHRATTAERRVSQAEDAAKEFVGFVRDATPYLIGGRLIGQEVVIVTYDEIDQAPLTEARDALSQAGANVVAILSVTGKVASTDEDTRAQLAKVLGQSSPSPAPPSPTATSLDPLVVGAAEELGDRLANGHQPGDLSPKAGRPDVLRGLIGNGFVKSPVRESDLSKVGGPGQVVLVITGGNQAPPVQVEEFMLPLVEQVGQHSATWLAVGENTESSVDPLVPTVRTDSSLSADAIVTVDDLDADFGGISLVLGLQVLIQDGRGGSYGVESGTDGLIPQAP